MKKLLLVSCASLMTLGAIAQTETSPSFVTSEKTEIKATVQDIDHDKREVTVKGPNGNTIKLKVGEQARNLDQVKKGDQITMTYYESAALSLAKKGEAPITPTHKGSVVISEKGQKPAGLAVGTTQISATVENIDRDKREVTLKGPEGNTVKVKVDERVGDLTRIKEGDEVVATYTEALAISVKKPN